MTYLMTECKMHQKVEDFPIYIYHTLIDDQEKRFEENSKHRYDLMAANNVTVAYSQNLIGSFCELNDLCGISFVKKEYRAINCMNTKERSLLERLIIKEIERRQNKKEIIAKNRSFLYVKAKKHLKDWNLVPKLQLDCQIDLEGNIFLGFDLSFEFIAINDIIAELNSELIGKYVVDLYNNLRYEVVRIGPELITEKVDSKLCDFNESVFEFLSRKNRKKWLKGNLNVPTVYVKNAKGVILAYAPQQLRKFKSPQEMDYHCRKWTKMGANEKTRLLIRCFVNVMKYCGGFLSWDKKGFMVERNGWCAEVLQSPLLVFKNGYITKEIRKGLKRGIINRNGKSISYGFIIDKNLVRTELIKPLKNIKDELENKSKSLGVQLKLHPFKKSIDFTNSREMTEILSNSVDEFRGHVIIPILSNHVHPSAYDKIKSILGREGIATQNVFWESLISKNEYTYLNLLLGIYNKAGIQPYILKNRLSADVYLGLDVSHEEGKHAAGCIQLMGSNGMVISSQVVSGFQAGERIETKMIQEIIEWMLIRCNQMNISVSHLVIHRDGKAINSEIEDFKQYLDEEGISFDYVAVKKNHNRRMIIEDHQRYVTRDGLLYLRKNEAYLCSTNPSAKMGMARPIKVEKSYGSTPMKKIVQDIYCLTYMNTHALNRFRHPATIFGADGISKFKNRGWLPSSKNDARLLHV